MESMKESYEKEIKKHLKTIEVLKKQMEDMRNNGQASQSELAELQDKIKDLQRENASIEKKVEKFSEAAAEAATLKEKLSKSNKSLKEACVELDIVSIKLKEESVKRKKLLNELEDMKGKVRVYCRIRPFSKSEKAEAERAIPCFKILDETNIDIGVTKNKIKNYSFDSVFGPESSQDDVFEETKRLIQQAIDGYNVCIFAYGQTGSGKTFTIQGTPDNPGLTPRSIVEMFDILKSMTNFSIKLSCYMVELYLNSLHDLLLHKGQEEKPLDIKESATGMVSIQNVTEIELLSIA